MNITTEQALWQKLYAIVEKELADGPGCHDFAHILRVLHNAERIAESENVKNLFALRVGALLHDIARPEEQHSNGKLCHAQIGAGKAADILRQCGCGDESFISLVSNIVRSHRYRGGTTPETLEERIVYDADKLDSLGAFGVARSFHFAGRIGARLHNTQEEAINSEAYSREDTAYREYLVKLRYLPEKMLTSTGVELAKKRAEFMFAFFDELEKESIAQE